MCVYMYKYIYKYICIYVVLLCMYGSTARERERGRERERETNSFRHGLVTTEMAFFYDNQDRCFLVSSRHSAMAGP